MKKRIYQAGNRLDQLLNSIRSVTIEKITDKYKNKTLEDLNKNVKTKDEVPAESQVDVTNGKEIPTIAQYDVSEPKEIASYSPEESKPSSERNIPMSRTGVLSTIATNLAKRLGRSDMKLKSAQFAQPIVPSIQGQQRYDALKSRLKNNISSGLARTKSSDDTANTLFRLKATNDLANKEEALNQAQTQDILQQEAQQRRAIEMGRESEVNAANDLTRIQNQAEQLKAMQKAQDTRDIIQTGMEVVFGNQQDNEINRATVDAAIQAEFEDAQRNILKSLSGPGGIYEQYRKAETDLQTAKSDATREAQLQYSAESDPVKKQAILNELKNKLESIEISYGKKAKELNEEYNRQKEELESQSKNEIMSRMSKERIKMMNPINSTIGYQFKKKPNVYSKGGKLTLDEQKELIRFKELLKSKTNREKEAIIQANKKELRKLDASLKESSMLNLINTRRKNKIMDLLLK